MSEITGIDVSAYQGTFDWEAHKGIGFAGLRATSWSSATAFEADAQLVRNAAQTWDVFDGRIPRLYYHETRVQTGPAAQANCFVAVVGAHLCRGDVLVAAMEDTGGARPADVAAWHREFMRALLAATDKAHRAIVYCNPSWAEAGNCEGLGGYGLWLASYGVAEPVVPEPWKHWLFWQRSGTGLDEDVWNGTAAGLAEWAMMPTYRR
jgi:lysozyme